MFVCVCHAVSLPVIRDAIASGADTVEEVERRTCAGSDCGSCRDEIQDLLDEHHGCATCPNRVANAA